MTTFFVNYCLFLANLIATNDPRSYMEAMTHEGSCASMRDEIRALEENGTRSLEPLPLGKRALGSPWVYQTFF